MEEWEEKPEWKVGKKEKGKVDTASSWKEGSMEVVAGKQAGRGGRGRGGK